MRYWKLFFLQGYLKNLNFFLKKNSKFLNSHLIVQEWTIIFLGMVDNLYLLSYMGLTSLTISNLFINNIENILKVKFTSKNPYE